MRERKVMIGILYGVRSSLLINFMRKDCKFIRKLIILGIIINCVGRTILSVI